MTPTERAAHYAERAARYAAAEANALANALADLEYAARTGDAPAAIACTDIALDAADSLAPIAPNVTDLARAVIAEQSTPEEYARAAALATDLAAALADAVTHVREGAPGGLDPRPKDA